VQCPLLTLHPHTSRLQFLTVRTGQTNPPETLGAVGSVHSDSVAPDVPESAAGPRRTVPFCPSVVLAVIRGELGPVAPEECVLAGVTRVAGHMQQVVVCLGLDYERVVLGVKPFAVI